MASNIKVDIVRPTATNGSLSLKGDSGGSATANGITVNSSGNTSITGTTTLGGNLVIPNSGTIGSASDTDAITIDSSGNVTLAEKLIIHPAKGIQFRTSTGGTGIFGSGILDDYEEGTWAPAFDSSNGDATFTYAQQRGNYTKVGRLVTVTFWIQATATSIGTGSNCVIEGLPFSQNALATFRHGSAAFGLASGFVTTQPTGVYYIEAATTSMFLTGITPSNFNTVSDMILYGQFYFYQA